jgi:Flp pilus assembly protein TadG
MKKFFQDISGQSLVEMALVLPILILLLLCIVEGGRIFAGYLELESAARDGARYASINTSKSGTEVETYIKTRLTLLDGSKLLGNPTILSRTSTGSGANEERQVEVRLKYPLDIMTPVIRDILNDPFYLQVSIAMRSE